LTGKASGLISSRLIFNHPKLNYRIRKNPAIKGKAYDRRNGFR
jgi:hypothetical protein